LRHGRPSADWGAGPGQPRYACFTRSTRTAPRGANPVQPEEVLFELAVPDAERRQARLQGFHPCGEPGPLGRFLGRFRGRCPPGLHLSRALSRCVGGQPFWVALPSRASTTGAVGPTDRPHASQGLPPQAWTRLLRGPSALLRFSTLSFGLPVRSCCRLWLPPMVPEFPFGTRPIRFPSSLGSRCRFPSGPLRGGPSRPSLRSRRSSVSVTDR